METEEIHPASCSYCKTREKGWSLVALQGNNLLMVCGSCGKTNALPLSAEEPQTQQAPSLDRELQQDFLPNNLVAGKRSYLN